MKASERIIHDDGTLRALGPPPSTSHLHALQERADASAERLSATLRMLSAFAAPSVPERFSDGREVS